jgi:predicted GNAT superfamily acetyltransferase
MEKRGSTFTAISHASVQRALDLNNRHAMELSLLTLDGFEKLIARANYAKWCPGETGFLIALDERADYPNPNFEWFRARFAQFVYIDRVVVDEAHRGQGLARRLYEDLFKTIDRSLVVCEVNLVPPNPASDAFHARLGFSAVGSALLADRQKTVRYLGKHLYSCQARPDALP